MEHRQHRLEHWVHWTLLGGLSVSAVLLVAGILAMLAQGEPAATPHQPLGELVRESTQFKGPALTVLGLLVLMITPILRVVILLLGWTLQREWRFSAVSLVVLVLLIVSLLLGTA